MQTDFSQISPLRWCFSSMGCAELTLLEILTLASQWGIPEVELRSVGGQLDLPACARTENWLSLPSAKTSGGQPARVINFSSSLRLSAPFTEAVPTLAAYAPLAAHLGTPYLRVFDDGIRLPADIDAIWHWLDQWEELRAANGWEFDLLIETHSALTSADAVRKVFVRGHPHVHLLWDPHNVWKQTNAKDPLAEWQALKPHTRIIHIKDSIPVPDGAHPYSYVPPGQGEFPLADLLTLLERDGYKGSISLEWERLWHPQLPPISTALAALSKVAASAHHSAGATA